MLVVQNGFFFMSRSSLKTPSFRFVCETPRSREILLTTTARRHGVTDEIMRLICLYAAEASVLLQNFCKAHCVLAIDVRTIILNTLITLSLIEIYCFKVNRSRFKPDLAIPHIQG